MKNPETHANPSDLAREVLETLVGDEEKEVVVLFDQEPLRAEFQAVLCRLISERGLCDLWRRVRVDVVTKR